MRRSPTPSDAALRDFVRTLSALTPRDLRKFLRDVATTRELAELSARWQAARLLAAGESYRAISQKTGLSTATVTRVAAWLAGPVGGYRAALKISATK